jgi:hypothetical protein
MIGEARKNGMRGPRRPRPLTDVRNIGQKGTRLGNWLTREQAKELLAVPDRSKRFREQYGVGCDYRRTGMTAI